MIRVFLSCFLTLGLLSAYDAGFEGPGLSADLITENRSVTAGQPFTVGLHIHHFAGFHTYWQNPGMVGMEPSIEWTLPEGFTASEIQWPYPQHTHMGEYPCFGFERDVTLLVTITPPAELKEAQVTLKAATAWMACSKGCFPGFQTFNMTLPVTANARPDQTARALIAEARTQLPKSDPDARITLLTKSTGPEIKLKIQHPRLASESEIFLFSTDRQISSDHVPKMTRQPDGSIILTVPRSEFSPEAPTTLPAVLQMGTTFLAVTGKYP